MSGHVWITTQPLNDRCMCWRDAVCTHGWTWQATDDGDDRECPHRDAYEPVHRSFADAVRSLWSVSGRSGIGRLLRQPVRGEGSRVVYVMPPDAVIADDHDVVEGEGSFARFVITRTPVRERGEDRALAEMYRDV